MKDIVDMTTKPAMVVMVMMVVVVVVVVCVCVCVCVCVHMSTYVCGEEVGDRRNSKGERTDSNVGSFFRRITTPTGVMHTKCH